MVEKQLLVCLAGLLAIMQPVLGQGYVQQAEEKAEAGDFSASISLYQRAIDAAGSRGQKLEIQKAQDEVTRNYFASLYEGAVAASSRAEQVRLLGLTHALELRGWVATDFEQVVIAAQQLTDEIFEELQQEADSASLGKALDEAAALYDQARELDPRTFEKNNMEPLYQEVLRQIRLGNRLAQEGLALLSMRQFQEAKEKFNEAAQVYPGEIVEAGLRRTDSMILVVDGERSAEASWHRRAESAFEKALELDEGNEGAERLLEQSRVYRDHVHQGRILFSEGKCEESKREFQEAWRRDSRRFSRNGLRPLLEGDCQQRLPLPREELQEALLALFEGEVGVSIEILEVLLEEMGDSHIEIPALLGAAYGHSAYSSPDSQDPQLDNARQQFRTVLKIKPDYQLPEKLLSPRIIALFDQLREEVAKE